MTDVTHPHVVANATAAMMLLFVENGARNLAVRMPSDRLPHNEFDVSFVAVGDDEPTTEFALTFVDADWIAGNVRFYLDDARRNHNMLMAEQRFDQAGLRQRVLYGLSFVQDWVQLGEVIGRERRMKHLFFVEPSGVEWNEALTAVIGYDAETKVWSGLKGKPINPFDGYEPDIAD